MVDAQGSRIHDADRNEYVDFDMAFGVLAAGHSHPVLADVLAHRVRERHLLHVPGRGQHPHGRGDQAPLRLRSGPLLELRHGGDDGRDPRRARLHRAARRSCKFEGGYHGHHDDVLVSIQPPREFIGPTRRAGDRACIGRPAAISH